MSAGWYLLLVLLLPVLVSFVLNGWLTVYISRRFTTDDIPSLKGQVFLVTGGNSGIGKVMVKELSRHGAHVISTARSREKCNQSINDIKESLNVPSNSSLEKSAYGKVECLILDLASFRSIENFKNEFSKRSKTVNGIILNAGLMMSPYNTTVEGFEMQLGVNYIGHWYLINQFERIIQKSKNVKNPVRIVTVASNAHEGSYPEGIRFESFQNSTGYNSVYAYGQSKLANVLFSNELARRLNNTGVTSNSCHPGMIQTNLGRYIEDMLHQSLFMKFLYPLFALMSAASMSVEQGALTPLYLATSPQVSGITGKYFQPIGVEVTPSHHAKNLTLQQLLWTHTERLIKK